LNVASGYLLDTNVISETRKVRANANVMSFLAGADSAALFLSVLSLGELRKGVEAKRRVDPHAAGLLNGWIDRRRHGETVGGTLGRARPAGHRHADRRDGDSPRPHPGDPQYA
jgi:hypothetical protein